MSNTETLPMGVTEEQLKNYLIAIPEERQVFEALARGIKSGALTRNEQGNIILTTELDEYTEMVNDGRFSARNCVIGSLRNVLSVGGHADDFIPNFFDTSVYNLLDSCPPANLLAEDTDIEYYRKPIYPMLPEVPGVLTPNQSIINRYLEGGTVPSQVNAEDVC